MGKKGWWVLFFVILLVAAVVVSGIFFLIYRYTPQEPTTLTEQIFLTVIAVGVSIFITWIFSRRIAHEDLKRAAARAVRLIENTKKDAAALYDKALEERGQVSKELENYPESKKVVDRCFDWLIYSLERLRGRISDTRDDWRDFLPEEFEQQRELQAEENELRAQRDASAAQLEEMLAVETSKSEEVRELAEKLENLEQRLGVIEATPSPITGAPREAPVRDAYYWFRRGLRYSARGQYEEAIEAYDKAIELRKDYPEALNNKGVALAGLGRLENKPERFQEAIQCFDKALELRKDFPDALVNKGAALCEVGRLEKKREFFYKAIHCYDKALELREDYPEALSNKGAALADLGRLENKPERFQEAIECYEKALELTDNKDPDAWYNKACALAGLKEKDKMLEALREAVRLDAKNKEDAQKEEDFKAYWEDEDFKAVVK